MLYLSCYAFSCSFHYILILNWLINSLLLLGMINYFNDKQKLWEIHKFLVIHFCLCGAVVIKIILWMFHFVCSVVDQSAMTIIRASGSTLEMALAYTSFWKMRYQKSQGWKLIWKDASFTHGALLKESLALTSRFCFFRLFPLIAW